MKLKSNSGKSTAYVPHTINVPSKLDERISRCMGLEHLRNFSEFSNSALARKCREIEREHGIDADGQAVKS